MLARASLAACTTTQELEAFLQDLARVQSAFAEQTGALDSLTLMSPVRARTALEGLSERVLGSKAKHTLLLLAEHRELGSLKRFTERVRDLAETEGRLTSVHVTLANEITPADQRTLAAHLEQTFGTPVSVDYSVDAHALGGIRIDTRDKQFDTTLRGRLQRLTHHLSS